MHILTFNGSSFCSSIQSNCKEITGHGRRVLGKQKILRHIKIGTGPGLFLSCCNYLLGCANEYTHDNMGQMTPQDAESTAERFLWVLFYVGVFTFFN